MLVTDQAEWLQLGFQVFQSLLDSFLARVPLLLTFLFALILECANEIDYLRLSVFNLYHDVFKFLTSLFRWLDNFQPRVRRWLDWLQPCQDGYLVRVHILQLQFHCPFVAVFLFISLFVLQVVLYVCCIRRSACHFNRSWLARLTVMWSWVSPSDVLQTDQVSVLDLVSLLQLNFASLLHVVLHKAENFSLTNMGSGSRHYSGLQKLAIVGVVGMVSFGSRG